MDLASASREDLLALIAQLEATVAALQTRIRALEARLLGGAEPVHVRRRV